MDKIKRNVMYSGLMSALHGIAALFVSGTLIQTLLKILGFSSQLIYIHSTLLQFANVAVIMLCSRWADKGNIVKRVVITSVIYGSLFLLYIPVCICKSASMSAYIFLVFISVFQAVMTGLYTVCAYKLPYHIHRPQDYRMVQGISGIILAILNTFIGFLITRLNKYYAYENIMLFSFIISAVLIGIASWLACNLKTIPPEESGYVSENSKIEKKIPLKEMFMHPTFTQLFPANLFRGISSGVINILAVVAFDLGFDESVATSMVPVQSVATLIGCVGFVLLSKKMSSRLIAFMGSLGVALLPLCVIPERNSLLIVYGIIIIGRMLVDYAVPSALIFVVPEEIAGTYHAWRMALHNGGMFLGTFIATFIPTFPLLIIACVIQLIS